MIGAWRLQACVGAGAYGAVYRAVSWRDEHAPPVALKLALHPEDPRFAREGVLLSRCDHPSIPRLVDQGTWESPVGTRHPFLVMQWVAGEPLYEHARPHPLSPERVRRWLAQLAQALAVLHAQGAVHRDLKGGNVLVRRSDDRAMLMDLGTGLYPGAAELTPAMSFPGTPAYRSPESCLFEIQFHGSRTARYRPSAADDLYALGITACRLLTGEYLALPAPFRDAHGIWRMKGLRTPRMLRRVLALDPSLRELIRRLLSVNPEERGTAAQLAQELESAAPGRRFWPSFRTRSSWRYAWLGLSAAAAGLALSVWARRAVSRELPAPPTVARVERPKADSEGSGTAGLGEAATVAALDKKPMDSTDAGMGADPLPEPEPGQARADEKGHCPRRWLVALNGACWTKAAWEHEQCEELGGQMFKGNCYVPFSPSRRKRPGGPVSGHRE